MNRYLSKWDNIVTRERVIGYPGGRDLQFWTLGIRVIIPPSLNIESMIDYLADENANILDNPNSQLEKNTLSLPSFTEDDNRIRIRNTFYCWINNHLFVNVEREKTTTKENLAKSINVL